MARIYIGETDGGLCEKTGGTSSGKIKHVHTACKHRTEGTRARAHTPTNTHAHTLTLTLTHTHTSKQTNFVT